MTGTHSDPFGAAAGVRRCSCGSRDAWRVTMRNANYSAFNGYRRTWSPYSEVRCEPDSGGCGARWRTKAKYVDALPDSYEGIEHRAVEGGSKGTRTVAAPASVGRASSFTRHLDRVEPLTCSRCGKQGGPILGPLTTNHLGTIFHRDGC